MREEEKLPFPSCSKGDVPSHLKRRESRPKEPSSLKTIHSSFEKICFESPSLASLRRSAFLRCKETGLLEKVPVFP